MVDNNGHVLYHPDLRPLVSYFYFDLKKKLSVNFAQNNNFIIFLFQHTNEEVRRKKYCFTQLIRFIHR